MKPNGHGMAMLSMVLSVFSTATVARAEDLVLSASQVTVLVDDGTDTLKVALLFDLTDLLGSGGRLEITSATLEWPLDGMPEDRLSEYTLHPVTAPWEGDEAPVVFAKRPADQWDFTPMDRAVLGQGLVRFNLERILDAWIAATIPNYGIVVATGDMSREVVARQLDRARLKVVYGTRR